MPYLSTILIGLVVLAVVAFAVRCTWKEKKKGGCSCGGSCGGCSGHCHDAHPSAK
ncbi:FeoB-associated Cys-rich membrane protein [Pseudoflavonifractor sp. DSM 107456]|uniref:FeoB-associated Cys-rich membrane protein n=2 Tax=Pseudoflavonifractor TaxID=1017280 RepID=A0ABR9RFA1_9FIRM|nr:MULTISPECIES: FeoB-associated Cys-rich membrane protein [Eubacteriales]MBC5732007.1 FeoB-associated Cys-rich membrane protein [Pseudoflavonifractor hominis]MBE5057362.1 FeoB-associated Cys-rich membrane protein [Pseudoflavonifractor gallinarum]MBS5136564.1 FeoB-associated Cys-rich membrane protein [Oscillospiraceae bacterium]MBT9683914.1 FeoB-associated Cys-rich membrane protein [Pseudoflavonifractor sp. MCC625]